MYIRTCSGVWKSTTDVAIKLELPSSESIDIESIEREALHFDAIGRHANVVGLYGVCLDAPQGGLLLVMEFCEHGSLDKHLRGTRDRLTGAICTPGILEVREDGMPTKVCMIVYLCLWCAFSDAGF